jgi:dipeptidyl aminopeptidase/acylaminoacyl peptidase
MIPTAPAGFEAASTWWQRVLGPGLGQISGGRHLVSSPDGKRAAFTGTRLDRMEGRHSLAVCLLDVGSGQVQQLTQGPGESQAPSWSPTSDRLAFLSDRARPGVFQPYLLELADPSQQTVLPMPGLSAESLEWCADGRHLLVLAADEGAEQAAAGGSGGPPTGNQGQPSWAPEVHRSGGELTGWRRAYLLDLSRGKFQQISPPELNVWEGCLAGDALLAVVSEFPWEGDWVNSKLEVIGLNGSWRRRLHEPKWQLGWPAASADGARLAIVEAIASDRGLVAGNVLLFDREGGGAKAVPTDGVDVTWLRFRNDHTLCYGGVRDTETVFGELDLVTGAQTQILDSPVTTSWEYPSAALDGGQGLLVLAEEWQQPPFVGRASGGKLEEVASLSHPGFEWLRDQLGPLQKLSWESGDGTRVSGLCTLPLGTAAPHPTVLLVHGGPAHLWNPRWSGAINGMMVAAYLAYSGFAVLMPNPRGSSGRGQGFLELQLGDYGGAEVEDDLTGLDRLVAQGIAHPDRLGVMGVSHGGYMTCWLTTKTHRFKAAVASSPVTDWYSQHFGSNIPEFDSMYLKATPTEPGGPYFNLSPTFFAHLSETPTLLTAGLRDRCTPPGQAIEFHQALLAAGIETELVLYPEEGHGVRSLPAQIDYAARVVDFLSRHLLKDA